MHKGIHSLVEKVLQSFPAIDRLSNIFTGLAYLCIDLYTHFCTSNMPIYFRIENLNFVKAV